MPPSPDSAPDPALRVLQVLPALEAGGVERGTVEIAQAVAAAGGDALVASRGGRLVAAVARAGGRHATLPLDTKSPLGILRNAGRLAQLVRAEGIRVIHARSRAPAWSALWAARRTGVPFVTTFHGLYGEELPGKHRYNAVMAAGDRVIAISRYVAEHVARRHGVGPDRLRVIPRGVDTALFDPASVLPGRIERIARAWRLPDGAPVVLLPARLTRWKGQAVLLDAVARLPQRDAVCVMLGEGRPAYARELMDQAAKLGLADRVRLPGHCDDMPAALTLAGVVVHASTRPEPFGRAVIEAQAMGRPVVAADDGGAVETVEHGVTGWRVPPGDPEALAAFVAHALALQPEERAALGMRGRDAACERFDVRLMQAATLDVYRELL